MSNVNVWACAVAVVAAFAASAVYYGILGEPAATEVRRPAWATPIVELARNALLVVLVAGLVSRLDPGFTGALLLAAGLFLVPLVLLAGAVFHEGTAMSAAVHLGDWPPAVMPLRPVTGDPQSVGLARLARLAIATASAIASASVNSPRAARVRNSMSSRCGSHPSRTLLSIAWTTPRTWVSVRPANNSG